MRRGWQERFPRHRLQRKPLVSDPGMHHGTCALHVSWCMSGSLTRGGRTNVPDMPSACATRCFTHLVRGPWLAPAYCAAFGVRYLLVYTFIWSTLVTAISLLCVCCIWLNVWRWCNTVCHIDLIMHNKLFVTALGHIYAFTGSRSLCHTLTTNNRIRYSYQPHAPFLIQ